MKAFLLLVLPALLHTAALAQTGRPADPRHRMFSGRITYQVTSESPDSSMLELFRSFAPDRYVVLYDSTGRVRVTEEGANARVDMIVDRNHSRYLQVERSEKLAYILTRNSVDSGLAPTQLRESGVTDTINGVPCRRYLVLASPFIRKNAIAYVWINDSVRVPMERAEFDNDESGFRGFFPLPLVIGGANGLVMKLAVTERYVTSSYTATLEPGPVPGEAFSIPADYAVR
ncbi:MAG TPA: hypothetical protein VHI13_04875 [Candidatus Kapabacteria bacterium]|nr:hypothetical protein [Candidatus Kapabacteria bacterium]